jgi:hypothetical protein
MFAVGGSTTTRGGVGRRNEYPSPRLGGSLPKTPWHSDLDRLRVRRTGWYDVYLHVVRAAIIKIRAQRMP